MSKDEENYIDKYQTNTNDIIRHGEDPIMKEEEDVQENSTGLNKHQQQQEKKKNNALLITTTTYHATEEAVTKTYSKYEKMMITCIVAFFCFVSSLSNRSYFPALPLVAKDFNVSDALVNITITVYMVFQGFSPCFWGPFSDILGRRPVYLASFILFIGSCLGLAIVPSFSGLLVLRMLQAFSESSCNAIGFGTVGDIVAPAERASYTNIIGTTLNTSMALSPIIGGLISYQFSWRWIFWFLLILGVVTWVAVLLFLPETLRSIVDGGNETPNNNCDIPIVHWIKKIKMLLYRRHSSLSLSKATISNVEIKSGKPSDNRRKMPNFLEQILFLRYPDILLTTISISNFGSITISLLMTTTPSHFSRIYNLNTFQIGLCYIPFAIGCIIGSFVFGRILDRSFKKIALKNQMTLDTIKSSRNVPIDFPIFRARLQGLMFITAFGQLVIISYGWILHVKAHLVVPLILQFLAGLCSTPLLISGNSLLIDLVPHRSASIMATNNLIASLFRALPTAIVEIVIDHIGLGWTFTLFGLFMSSSAVSLPILIKYGPKWRARRMEQQQKPHL